MEFGEFMEAHLSQEKYAEMGAKIGMLLMQGKHKEAFDALDDYEIGQIKMVAIMKFYETMFKMFNDD